MWKPLIVAVHGMCAGGAFYWLNECDVAICSDDATFFDPHTTYGMASALEPAALLRRISFGEVMRMALFGNDERISAARALRSDSSQRLSPATSYGTAPACWQAVRR